MLYYYLKYLKASGWLITIFDKDIICHLSGFQKYDYIKEMMCVIEGHECVSDLSYILFFLPVLSVIV